MEAKTCSFNEPLQFSAFGMNEQNAATFETHTWSLCSSLVLFSCELMDVDTVDIHGNGSALWQATSQMRGCRCNSAYVLLTSGQCREYSFSMKKLWVADFESIMPSHDLINQVDSLMFLLRINAAFWCFCQNSKDVVVTLNEPPICDQSALYQNTTKAGKENLKVRKKKHWVLLMAVVMLTWK